MSRLFLDVTQLAEWPGKLTGIPRAMNELSSRFSREAETRLLVWNRGQVAFREIGFDELTAHRRTLDAPSQPAAPNASAARALATRARMAAARLVDRSALGSRLLRYPRKLLDRRASFRAGPDPFHATTFRSGDSLLVMWGDWGSDAYIQELARLQEGGVKLAQIAYDMLPIVTPQYSGHATESLTRYTRGVYPICRLIAAISHNTRKDVAEWLTSQGLAVPPIEVIRLGDDYHYAGPKRPAAVPAGHEDFIACVGTIEVRKNHALLYYVYKLAAHRGIRLPKLVVVGRRGWQTEQIYEQITHDPETRNSFIFLHDASDEELSWVYENCLFSIYPSFYEGWGLPIAESLRRGVPCIAANSSSMPEVAGALVTYFDPASTDECLEAIRNLVQPDTLARARERVRAYRSVTWDETFAMLRDHLGKHLNDG